MVWWLWLGLGIVLLGVELLSPGGFYVLFFGMAAIAVGVMAGLKLAGPAWAQWLLFSALAIVSMLVFRDPLLKKIGPKPSDGRPVDALVGEIATTVEPIALGAIGRVELRGTTWTARNADRADLPAGRRCRVEQVDGLLLLIRAE